MFFYLCCDLWCSVVRFERFLGVCDFAGVAVKVAGVWLCEFGV